MEFWFGGGGKGRKTGGGGGGEGIFSDPQVSQKRGRVRERVFFVMKERGYLNYLLIIILSKNITGLGGLWRVVEVLVGGWRREGGRG